MCQWDRRYDWIEFSYLTVMVDRSLASKRWFVKCDTLALTGWTKIIDTLSHEKETQFRNGKIILGV